jgi:hypothetical protein
MQRLDAENSVDMGMEYGDVAIAYDPFGIGHKSRKIQAVDDAHASVSPARTKDGPHPGIIQHLLHVGTAVGVAAGKLVFCCHEVVSGDHLESPGAEHGDGRLHFCKGYFSGGGDDGDCIAGF